MRRLLGNVHLRQDTTELRADRADQFLDQNVIVFSGQVEIAEPSDTLRADRVRYDSNTKVGQARGNVRIFDGEIVLTAPSMDYFSGQDYATFDEGARLETEGVMLTALRGRYLTDTDEALFRDSVRLVDSTTVLLSRRGRYNTQTTRADFGGNVRLERADGEDTAQLEADSVVHVRETEISRAYGGPDQRVRLRQGTARLEADSLRYDGPRDVARAYAEAGRTVFLRQLDTFLQADSVRHEGGSDQSFAYHNVRIERFGDEEDESASEPPVPDFLATGFGAAFSGTAPADSSQRIILIGEEGVNDEAQQTSRMTGRPLLISLRRDSLAAPGTPYDSALVRARLLTAQRRDSVRAGETEAARFLRLVAVEGVQLVDKRLSAVGDSAVLDRLTPSGEGSTDELRLFGKQGRRPTGWFDQSEVVGETLRLTARGGEPDSLRIKGRAFAATLDTTVQQVNQLKGPQILGLFGPGETGENALRRLAVWPRAEAIYFRGEGAELKEAVKLSADSLAFGFRNDALRSVTGARGIEGTVYSAEIIPAPFRLDGFQFDPARRPTREALLRREALPLLPPVQPPAAQPSAPDSLQLAPEALASDSTAAPDSLAGPPEVLGADMSGAAPLLPTLEAPASQDSTAVPPARPSPAP